MLVLYKVNILFTINLATSYWAPAIACIVLDPDFTPMNETDQIPTLLYLIFFWKITQIKNNVNNNKCYGKNFKGDMIESDVGATL